MNLQLSFSVAQNATTPSESALRLCAFKGKILAEARAGLEKLKHKTHFLFFYHALFKKRK